jgi:hypothetical protein
MGEEKSDDKCIRIVDEYKMYEQMEDNCENSCAICLDDSGGRAAYSLAEKFGCECKQIVHEVCLAEWVTRTLGRDVSGTVCCIMCRKPVGVWGNDVDVPVLPIIVGGVVNFRDDMLRRALARHQMNGYIITIKARLALIVCVFGVLLVFLLALLGTLK